jgi:hypothetical protein
MAVQLSTASITNYNGWFGCTIVKTANTGYSLTRRRIKFGHNKHVYVSDVLRPAFNRAFTIEKNVPSFWAVFAKSEIFYLKGTIPSVSCVFQCCPSWAPGTLCKHNETLSVVLSVRGSRLVCGRLQKIEFESKDRGFFKREQTFVCDTSKCVRVQEFYDLHMHYYVRESKEGKPIWPLKNPYGVNARRVWPYKLIKSLDERILGLFMSETLVQKIQRARSFFKQKNLPVNIQRQLKQNDIYTKLLNADIAFMEETGISIIGGEPQYESCTPIDERSFEEKGLKYYQLPNTMTYPIIVNDKVLTHIFRCVHESFTPKYLADQEIKFKRLVGRTPVKEYNSGIRTALDSEPVPPRMGELDEQAQLPKRGGVFARLGKRASLSLDGNKTFANVQAKLKRLRNGNGPVDFTSSN